MYLPWLPIFLLHDFFWDIYSETSYRAGYKTLEILCLSIVGRELSPDFYHLLLAQEPSICRLCQLKRFQSLHEKLEEPDTRIIIQ